ncbi:unnamed protein product [Menidia menidia]|uniref:(Atlantic silverside) hypothetical protein n=1 Tax=Menidia menidia TaxID=238744 RepID=A0A8S4B820_9TELE|nr:unnamed protein product [Menidia menidia]
MSRALTEPISSSFREDAPRPPVPGEEGEAPCYNRSAKMRAQSKAKDAPVPGSVPVPGSTPRRNEDGLGEPEGSASPDSPLVRWTKSLHFLLGDQDGAQLFKTFLERENCADALDFWFACNGFRQMDLRDSKTPRVARVIFKRYVENNSVVAKQLKPATKTFIRDSVKKQQIDSAMFDQAQTEIQAHMEENAYQMFLTSDIYLDYVRTGCENAAYMAHGGLGSLKLVCGYLPPLMEEEEWSCADLKAKAFGSVVGLSAKNLRATATLRTAAELLENSCSYFPNARDGREGEGERERRQSHMIKASQRNVPVCLCPPALQLVKGVGGVGAEHQLASLMAWSGYRGCRQGASPPSKTNCCPPPAPFPSPRLALPRALGTGRSGERWVQRTHRLPKEMTPVEPSAFAAQLIAKLEKLKREQDAMSSLEERLQQIQEEDEREESPDLSGGSSLHHPLLPSAGHCEEDPQAILDEHLSRVLKTPGCQSPGVARHSPRSRSPERAGALASSGHGPYFGAYRATPKLLVTGRPSTKHIHHHYIHHHHAGPKSKEQIESEAAQRVQCLCPPGGATYSDFTPARCSTLSRRPAKTCEEGVSSPCLPLVSTDRSQNVWQWILESERQGKHKPHSSQGLKKSGPLDPKALPARPSFPWGGGGLGGGAHLRSHHPGHPFIQDPAMPPLPPPNTLAQLEEACRRLEEVSKPPKQRHSAAAGCLQRDRSHPAATFPFGGGQQPNPGAPSDESKELVVTYFFCGEEIPYRSMMKTHCLTLGHFKDQLSKKGNYRDGGRGGRSGEDEREESPDLSGGSSLHHPLLPSAGHCEEDPQAILDEHLSRVLKTPGCQSPGVARHSPRSRSPERAGALASSGHGPYFGAYRTPPKLLVTGRPSTKHIHHHYIHHHHAGPKSKEQIESEAAQRVQCLCPPGGATYSDFTPARCSTLSRRPAKACEEGVSSPCLPLVSTDRSQNVWQWILESERQGKHKPHSSQGLKKSSPLDPKALPARPSFPWGGGGLGGGAHLRSHHPGHPFIQDPAMPPLPPPHTPAPPEEACPPLGEVSKPPKQRHSAAAGCLQRDRSHPAATFPSGGGQQPNPGAPSDESKELVVTYFFCGEEIPYRSMMKTHCLTLGHFKDQLSKKGNYR